MLTHQAYLDALQQLRSTTAEWRSVLAGFLVLRLIDTQLADIEAPFMQDTTGVSAVLEAISGIQERDPVLPWLIELVKIITQFETPTTVSLEKPMISYGRMLFQKDVWTLALDVFGSLMSHSLAVCDYCTAVSTAIRPGFVLKELDGKIACPGLSRLYKNIETELLPTQR